MIFDIFAQVLTPEIRQLLVIAGMIFALLHVLAVLFIFRQVLTAGDLIKTPFGGLVKLMAFGHVLLTAAVLLLIIIY